MVPSEEACSTKPKSAVDAQFDFINLQLSSLESNIARFEGLTRPICLARKPEPPKEKDCIPDKTAQVQSELVARLSEIKTRLSNYNEIIESINSRIEI